MFDFRTPNNYFRLPNSETCIPTWSRQGNRRIHGGRSPICLFSPTKHLWGGPLVLVVVLVVVVTLPCKNNLMRLRIWKYELCAYPVLIIPSIMIQRKMGAVRWVKSQWWTKEIRPWSQEQHTGAWAGRWRISTVWHGMVKHRWKRTWKRTFSRGHFHLQLPTLFCGFRRSTSIPLSDSDLSLTSSDQLLLQLPTWNGTSRSFKPNPPLMFITFLGAFAQVQTGSTEREGTLIGLHASA